MGYGSGSFPMERASKLGHMKVIEHEHVGRLIRQFEETATEHDAPIGGISGTVDLNAESGVRFIVTVDGGQAVIPNEVRRDKRMAFISFCAMLIRREDIARLRENPIIDPRDLSTMFKEGVWYQAAALPLAGITLPGESVRQTIRNTVDAVLEYTRLYDALKFLVYRQWDPSYEMDPKRNPEAPHMDCIDCGDRIYLPKDAFNFRCLKCGAVHRLSDYLGVAQTMPENWAREESAISLRNAMETLTLFHFISRQWQKHPEVLSDIVFLKDGPLLLRAQLSRLVEPVRDFIEMLKAQGLDIKLVGIEKNGELADHIEDLKKHLPNPGDYFLPSVPYLIEEVAGQRFDASHYRNRVQYGAKVVVRLGTDHVVPLDVPTGKFKLYPEANDLIGFHEIVSVLSEMLSYRHDNALIPIKLVNDVSSISRQPSGDILRAFAHHLVPGVG